jgi:D-beta-D-heptose 7-phosphate kinase/D-beta-D-heptose 1-phosphate adenosyltransferase
MKTQDHVKIMVVGDIMLDKYVVGEVERISPEAPVPIVRVTEEYSTLGGCGNVVRNLREIGAMVYCYASIGPDDYGSEIEAKLNQIGAVSQLNTLSKVTTVKERIVANSRKIQMLRVDREDTAPVQFPVLAALSDIDCVVVSDYAKGVVTPSMMEMVKNLAGDKPIIVDPKPENQQLYQEGIFMITPNEKEWNQMDKNKFVNMPYILVTKGKSGMELYDDNGSYNIPAHERHNVFNVSGAGDTVVAVMATCISMGIDAVKSARISNQCASYVVTQPGTTPVPRQIFLQAMLKHCGRPIGG